MKRGGHNPYCPDKSAWRPGYRALRSAEGFPLQRAFFNTDPDFRAQIELNECVGSVKS